MKKKILYTSIVILYLLTPLFVVLSLGAMVSQKYEVDERYWRVQGDNHLTPEQKQNKIADLDKRGRQLQYKAYFLAFIAFATFSTATTLIVMRNKILAEHKSSI